MPRFCRPLVAFTLGAMMVLFGNSSVSFADELRKAETSANVDQQKTYTLAEAGEISKTSPNPNIHGQIVFYYDASMYETYIFSLKNQINKLHQNGYYAAAVPGGPKDSVQVVVVGNTSNKLIFKGAEIFARKPQNYGAGIYLKFVGQPQTQPITN